MREWLNVQAASGFVVYDTGLDAYVAAAPSTRSSSPTMRARCP